MTSISNADRVKCTGEGLQFGYLNHPIYSTIDTCDAGPGELTVSCKALAGLQQDAYCELEDHNDGTFRLGVLPQQSGPHELQVRYDGRYVRGSPFRLQVSAASLVKVAGPAFTDGLISTYRSEFTVDTAEATSHTGPGELRIRIGGPRRAFRVNTHKKGRTLFCKYSPREAGVYHINITWDNEPLPGSPFQINLCHTEEELHRYQQGWG